MWFPAGCPATYTVVRQSTAPKCRRSRSAPSLRANGGSSLRYHRYCAVAPTPERHASTGKGTSTAPDRFRPNGGACPDAPGSYSHRPFRGAHHECAAARTSCGRGCSGRSRAGSTAAPQLVTRSPGPHFVRTHSSATAPLTAQSSGSSDCRSEGRLAPLGDMLGLERGGDPFQRRLRQPYFRIEFQERSSGLDFNGAGIVRLPSAREQMAGEQKPQLIQLPRRLLLELLRPAAMIPPVSMPWGPEPDNSLHCPQDRGVHYVLTHRVALNRTLPCE